MAQALHLPRIVQPRSTIASHVLHVGISLAMCLCISACGVEKIEPPSAHLDQALVARLFSALGLRLQSAVQGALEPATEELDPLATAPAKVSSVAAFEVRVPDAPDGTKIHLLSGVGLDAQSLGTDTSGLARFEKLEPGHYQVWAAAPGLASDLVTITLADAARRLLPCT